jgi:hypothetical protein
MDETKVNGERKRLIVFVWSFENGWWWGAATNGGRYGLCEGRELLLFEVREITIVQEK